MDIWAMQDKMASEEAKASKNYVKQLAQEGLSLLDTDSAALHENAKRNGRCQPLYAVRKKNKEIKVTVKMGDELFAGDYLEVFNETWIVMSTYKDECDILRGNAYLCNHTFRFQNGTADILEYKGVVDDGSYTSRQNNQIQLEHGSYKLYLPLNDDTEQIFLNKRFALNKTFIGAKGKPEPSLSVIEVVWIDKSSGNIGEGSHLLQMRTEKDEYVKGKDSVDEMICDYIDGESTETPEESETPVEPPATTPTGRCVISGAKTIRLGNTREYTLSVLDENGEPIDVSSETFVWNYDAISGITFTPANESLAIQVSNNSSLSGKYINLTVVDTNGNFTEGNFEVEVI